jgi:hypothetical protein
MRNIITVLFLVLIFTVSLHAEESVLTIVPCNEDGSEVKKYSDRAAKHSFLLKSDGSKEERLMASTSSGSMTSSAAERLDEEIKAQRKTEDVEMGTFEQNPPPIVEPVSEPVSKGTENELKQSEEISAITELKASRVAEPKLEVKTKKKEKSIILYDDRPGFVEVIYGDGNSSKTLGYRDSYTVVYLEDAHKVMVKIGGEKTTFIFPQGESIIRYHIR